MTNMNFIKAVPVVGRIGKAAVVSCGGICPGVNNVVSELTSYILNQGGTKDLIGFMDGFQGICEDSWRRLDLDSVRFWNTQGGTLLRTTRGNFHLETIIERLQQNQIKVLFGIGGDGTHRALNKLHTSLSSQNIPIQVIALPKTIDNDIPLIDYSFGYHTALQVASTIIQSAINESHSTKNTISIVQLMGRYCGAITANASLIANDVDLVLIPEIKFRTDKVVRYIKKVLKRKQRAVVVIGEGSGESLQDFDTSQGVVDSSGNLLPFNIGKYLETEFRKLEAEGITVRYQDPTFHVRAQPANFFDQLLCIKLAQAAVWGAIRGLSGYSVAYQAGEIKYIPLNEIVAAGNGGTRKISEEDPVVSMVMGKTLQPDLT